MEPNKQPVAERFVRDLMPGSTEDEIREGVFNFQEYMNVVQGIADRPEREGKEIAEEIENA